MTVAAALFVWLGGLEATWGTIREVFIGMINHGTSSLDPKVNYYRSCCTIIHGYTKGCFDGIINS